MTKKIYWWLKGEINWLLYLAKRIRAFSVARCFDDDGNYLYSVICIHSSKDFDNFVRIKYDANECSVNGEIDRRMKEILEKDIAQ